jgi:pilus assembly protein Flp/PilA
MGVKMKKLVNWLKNEESGQGMVEYGLLLALIAVVVISALLVLGPKVRDTFNKVNDNLPA